MNPRVVSQAEYGRRGQIALQAKYPANVIAAWRRRGGRPKDPSYDEIVANKGATRLTRRVSSSNGRADRSDFDSVT